TRRTDKTKLHPPQSYVSDIISCVPESQNSCKKRCRLLRLPSKDLTAESFSVCLPCRGTLFAWIVLYFSCCLDISQGATEDVDVLQKLGLTGDKSSARPVPQGVIPYKLGVILTQQARVEAPVHSVIPPNLGTNFTLVLSFSSHRISNAFLFAVKSKRKKLELGVQFIPGKIIVYVGHKQSVYFDYSVHDGQWHNMALGFQGQKVTLYTSCGKQRVNASLHTRKDVPLDSDGVFLLGKMNQHSVQFEGALCQFDIYPPAKAAHNYCKYLKKQCRQTDTYRPNLPNLVPPIPNQDRFHLVTELPSRSVQNLTAVIHRRELIGTSFSTGTKRIASSRLPTVKRTTKSPSLLASTSRPPTRIDTQLASSTVIRTATTVPRSSTSLPVNPLSEDAVFKLARSTSQSRTKYEKQLEKETKNLYQKSTIKPSVTSAASKQIKKTTGSRRSTNTITPKQAVEKLTSGSNPKNHSSVKWKVESTTSVLYTKPPSSSVPPSTHVVSANSPFAHDYYWLDPTPFPLLMGPPGPKGDQGSPHHHFLIVVGGLRVGLRIMQLRVRVGSGFGWAEGFGRILLQKKPNPEPNPGFGASLIHTATLSARYKYPYFPTIVVWFSFNVCQSLKCVAGSSGRESTMKTVAALASFFITFTHVQIYQSHGYIVCMKLFHPAMNWSITAALHYIHMAIKQLLSFSEKQQLHESIVPIFPSQYIT
ncbi:hypothetical protein XELAEV_18004122mg, partial [Xenopus laevis]